MKSYIRKCLAALEPEAVADTVTRRCVMAADEAQEPHGSVDSESNPNY